MTLPAETTSHGDYLKIAVDKNQRPRERLRAHGAIALKNEELIAILLRTGTRGENVLHLAEHLLANFGGLGGLARQPFNELKQLKGIGEVKAIELNAAFELGRRMLIESPEERPIVRSPEDAAKLLADMRASEQEVMRTVLLDTKNRVLATPTIYRGSLHTTVIRVTELFREAVRQNCAALILAHNHPSGDPTPSPEDIAVTREIVQAGKVLDIDVLDHVVIGAGDRFYSLKEHGLGF
ncbi:MAG: DNA repair protein RadC [Chloroflexi bacterium]|nr:DNA repair protein RadC [Chloroflexota bacterium]MBI3741462.1 DNA repair protein RadC [Chloroflexota bacterium]